ncbi:MAG: primosomal protein N' [Candidatus Delongbacteria bacterium]|jgi:primosomal protein N' (replication factor Y)|nr:primosomal protein N' [Candidatus Delongbacteria bacterium]
MKTDKTYINVSFPIPIDKEFTYSIDTMIDATIDSTVEKKTLIGSRVIANFNRRKIIGVITSLLEKKPDYRVIKIDRIIDPEPMFNEEILLFCKWISKYYLSSYGQVLKQALPTALYGTIDKFAEGNINKIKYLNFIAPVLPLPEKTFSKRINEFIDFLSKNTAGVSQKEVKEIYNFSDHIISKSVTLGLCEKVKKEDIRLSTIMTENINDAVEFSLTEEQNHCVNEIEKSINKNIFNTFLIYGLTGSGKTAVYIEAIKKVRAKNKTAIVLIPEISLTPQTVKNFREVFGNDVAILHSRLSEGEKYDSWRSIKKNKYSIVIGPRSAIFAPLENLGLIIVDEEHESAYKQSDPSPRYNARDMAIVRGKLNNIPVILGSATPSLEAFHNASTGKYSLLELTKRIGKAKLPEIIIVKRRQFYQIFEDSVIESFREELDQGRQIIVLQNRRGFSTHLVCESCGSASTCPNCSVSLTYHLHSKQLICHHCGYYEKAKDYCGICGKSNISFKGTGTEQVAFELSKLFPDNKILRMDQDSTRKKESHFKILREFENNKSSILVGTQMIAKGLDFHNVSLVCIVNVDTELIFPDYRSDERAFQLITQVSGRAGRGEIKGRVLVQTYSESNHVLEYAKNHDYIGYIKNELENRELAIYPPFAKMAKIMFSSKIYDEMKQASLELYKLLIDQNKKLIVYKPVDRMVLKVNNIYRMNIIVKTDLEYDSNGNILRSAIKNAYKNFKVRSNVKVSIDIDPLEVI